MPRVLAAIRARVLTSTAAIERNHPMRVLALISCILALSVAANAQDLPLPQRRVSVLVSCKDQRIQDQLASYIKRELRAFSDIAIVEKDIDLKLNVVAVVRQMADGTTSIAASVLVNAREGAAIKHNLKYSRTYKAEPALEHIDELVVVRFHFIVMDEADNLSDFCKLIVTTIDTDVFEADRKTFQYLNDRFKERQKKP